MKLTVNVTLITQALSILTILALEVGKVLPDGNKWKSVAISAVSVISAVNAYLAHFRTPSGDKTPPEIAEQLKQMAIAEDAAKRLRGLN